MGIEPTTSGLDLPSLCRLSYKVAQRKSGTILDGASRRRESKGIFICNKVRVLPQQRLPTPIQLLAVGGLVGVAIAYQGKDLISGEFTRMVPVELCSSAFKEILVTDINCSWGLFSPSPISSQ